MDQTCDISVITINYNGLEDTCALIGSIPLADNVEVIVVDNASKEDEATVIEQRYPHVKVVRSSDNLGFAGGNNLGIKAASGRYLFFINNDTEFPPGEWEHVEDLVRRMEADNKVGVVCPKIRFFWDDRPIQFAGYTPLSRITMRNRSIGFGEADHGQYDSPHLTPYAHGAAMLVSREAVEKAGLMPECFFLYYEELDWSMMFRRAGFDIWYDPACTIYHKESRSTGQGSPLRTYYIARNRLLFARRNLSAPVRWLTYCYLVGIVAMRDVLMHTFRRKPAIRRATLKGIADFVKGRSGRSCSLPERKG